MVIQNKHKGLKRKEEFKLDLLQPKFNVRNKQSVVSIYLKIQGIMFIIIKTLLVQGCSVLLTDS